MLAAFACRRDMLRPLAYNSLRLQVEKGRGAGRAL